ncbi:MAG: magnesium transporter [Flavobacteriaceae bacterium]|nr:MAG: magnesium transporter [Flavobacteriaceae bacterium]
MRKQAQEMERVTSVFVVNDQDELLGTLSLKRLLTAQNHEKIEAFYHENFFAVNANDKQEEVAKYIQKYDLYEVPVVDDLNRLVGTITVDDVLDVIKEEAEKDYQLASGISGDIDSRDSLTDSIKARLPWLLIGMIGGVLSSQILKTNQDTMSLYPLLILFIPLIGATAGNVGVQSSAIVVQGLANGTLNKDIWLNLIKEASIALVSGLFLSFVIFLYNYYANGDMGVALSVSMSLFLVVIVSASIGTIIPLLLNKYGIDPALATGPFITTSNDILGVIVYFLTAKLFLGI